MKKLNILVDISHPAHVHFFKNPIFIWKRSGHKVILVTRDKEITHQLLNELGFDYIPLTKQKTNILLSAIELLIRWLKIFVIIGRGEINVAISISGISTALPAYLRKIVAITDSDTEDALLSNKIAFRFSNVVLTPSTFLDKGAYNNIKTYESFHEFAYLHPNWFIPDRNKLQFFNIKEDERYIVIRLVSWKALHDYREGGISDNNLQMLIDLLISKGYNVRLSSERKTSSNFDKYLIKGSYSSIFDLMAFSSGYIGESPTMAVETAILGRPSVLINSRVKHLGNMVELQNRYGILFNFENFELSRNFIENDFFSDKLKGKVLLARQRLLQDKIDISEWIAKFTIDYTNDFIRRRQK